MYTSSTGWNWDDDDDNEFDFEVYKAAADFSAPTIDDLGPLQHAPTIEGDYEAEEFTTPVAPKSDIEYKSVHPYHWPSPTRATMDLWHTNEHRRPAYVEMSHEEGVAYPHQRISYNKNWLRTKMNMGFSMKHPLLMKPSPLQQSMTWEQDSEGEYIKENGLVFSPVSAPSMYYDSHSEDEQDDAITPVGTAPMVLAGECGSKIEEVSKIVIRSWSATDWNQYDPMTAAIELLTEEEEGFQNDLSRGFSDFNHISDALNIEDILGDAARDVLCSYINEPSECGDLYPNDELESKLAPGEATWEMKGDAPEEIDPDQIGKQALEESDKSISNPSLDLFALYTPSDLFSNSRASEEETSDSSVTSTSASDEDCVSEGPPIDLETIDTFADNLVNSGEHTQNDHAVQTRGAADPTTIWNDTTHIALSDASLQSGEDHVNTNYTAPPLTGFVEKTPDALETNTIAAVATPKVEADTKTQMETLTAEHDLSHNDIDHGAPVTATSKATYSSPDLKYIQNPGKTSLVWAIVSTGLFALFSLPWGRIAIAAAGALFDVVTF